MEEDRLKTREMFSLDTKFTVSPWAQRKLAETEEVSRLTPTVKKVFLLPDFMRNPTKVVKSGEQELTVTSSAKKNEKPDEPKQDAVSK